MIYVYICICIITCFPKYSHVCMYQDRMHGHKHQYTFFNLMDSQKLKNFDFLFILFFIREINLIRLLLNTSNFDFVKKTNMILLLMWDFAQVWIWIFPTIQVCITYMFRYLFVDFQN